MQGTKRQQGTALVLVLGMLSMSLMLGLSGLNGILINEQLAGS